MKPLSTIIVRNQAEDILSTLVNLEEGIRQSPSLPKQLPKKFFKQFENIGEYALKVIKAAEKGERVKANPYWIMDAVIKLSELISEAKLTDEPIQLEKDILKIKITSNTFNFSSSCEITLYTYAACLLKELKGHAYLLQSVLLNKDK